MRTIGKMKGFAQTIAVAYGSPVYLVGSALHKNKPRDVDIRLEMDDDQFALEFMDSSKWADEGRTGDWSVARLDWSRACTSATKMGWEMCKMNIDFQIYPKGHCETEYGGLPKVRIA